VSAVPPWRARRPLALAAAAAVAAGVALGIVIAPDTPEASPPPPAPKPRVGLSSGVAKLPLPADWHPLGRRSTLPGFEQATAVRAAGREAALDIRPPEDASLLPASVVAAAAPLPAPTLSGTDGRTAWRYELPGADAGSRVVAFALPTTGGVVTIACAPGDRVDPAATACGRAVSTVRLDGAKALTPAPETAAAIVLPDVLSRLNRARRIERGRLAAARSPRERDGAARRLAAAYDAAAHMLAPVAGGAAVPVGAAFTGLARDHRKLAAASLELRAAAARRSGARIARHERRLARRLAALTRAD
jgi:hypothetical protein